MENNNQTSNANNSEAEKTELRQTNQVITIEVSVDGIAKNLASKFAEDFPHANMLTNVIIGRALENDRTALGAIYNALNGWDDGIDFHKHQTVYSSEYECIGIVREVNPYRSHGKVLVEYQKDGCDKQTWMSHTSLSDSTKDQLNAYNEENPVFNIDIKDIVVFKNGDEVEMTKFWPRNSNHLYVGGKSRYRNEIASVKRNSKIEAVDPEA
jgi:hypothetical protein